MRFVGTVQRGTGSQPFQAIEMTNGLPHPFVEEEMKNGDVPLCH